MVQTRSSSRVINGDIFATPLPPTKEVLISTLTKKHASTPSLRKTQTKPAMGKNDLSNIEGVGRRSNTQSSNLHTAVVNGGSKANGIVNKDVKDTSETDINEKTHPMVCSSLLCLPNSMSSHTYYLYHVFVLRCT